MLSLPIKQNSHRIDEILYNKPMCLHSVATAAVIAVLRCPTWQQALLTDKKLPTAALYDIKLINFIATTMLFFMTLYITTQDMIIKMNYL